MSWTYPYALTQAPETMPGSRSIEALIGRSRQALTNARDVAAVQVALASFGVGAERLEEGLALVKAAEDFAIQQQDEYAERRAATATLHERTGAVRADFGRHVKLARVAFKPDTLAYKKLYLNGRRRESLDGLLAQARQFYRALLGDAETLAVMSGYQLDEAAARQMLDQLDAVEAARQAQTRETGEAQMATHQRDTAAATLRDFMRDFYRVAEIALEDQPQLREQLGMLERTA